MKHSVYTLSFLLGFLFSTSISAQNTAHDVVIVGAGSAGLYAARTLVDEGYDVLIIEATDRIGGRVHSATLGDMRIELGAEEHYRRRGGNPVWPAIRGEYGNSIYGNGYQGSEVYSMNGGAQTCWDTNGALFECADDPDVVQSYDVWDWYYVLNQHTDPNSTLADDVLDEYGVGPGHPAYHIYDMGFAGATYATNLDQLGARSVALESSQWQLSENISVIVDKDVGYEDALNTVWWDDVVANVDLLTNSPVVAIDTSGSDVVVEDSLGNLHAARQAIVTVSIGVLQSESIDFIPDLPAATVDAYNGIGIDKGMKVALRFSSNWWETEGVALAYLTTEGLASGCWVPSDYKQGSTSHIFMCYPMGDNADSLSALAANAGGGTAGDQAILNAILADLDATFPQAMNQASANFVEGTVMNWGEHPYTKGVYSFSKIGTYSSSNDSKRLDLQSPVAGNRVFFAGEGTNHNNAATVVGALQEGERAANVVASVNGNPNNPPPVPGGGGGGNYTLLQSDDFEINTGNWVDGGTGANHYNGGTWATSGQRALRIRNGGSESNFTTTDLSLSGMASIKVDFSYAPVGMDVGERFELQISTDSGSSFATAASWERNVDFSNRTFYSESIEISNPGLNNTTRLRFRNYGNQNNDRVFIDDVSVFVK
ncbi:MAG: NAD(P)/FAD-dependent oxidoreductase [Pseudomonadota bacterium]